LGVRKGDKPLKVIGGNGKTAYSGRRGQVPWNESGLEAKGKVGGGSTPVRGNKKVGRTGKGGKRPWCVKERNERGEE